MYPWYVYQPSPSKEKNGKGKGGDDAGDEGSIVEGKSGKSKREGKEKERREERKRSARNVARNTTLGYARRMDLASGAATSPPALQHRPHLLATL